MNVILGLLMGLGAIILVAWSVFLVVYGLGSVVNIIGFSEEKPSIFKTLERGFITILLIAAALIILMAIVNVGLSALKLLNIQI